MDSDPTGPVTADAENPFEEVGFTTLGSSTKASYMETTTTKPLLVLVLEDAFTHILFNCFLVFECGFVQ